MQVTRKTNPFIGEGMSNEPPAPPPQCHGAQAQAQVLLESGCPHTLRVPDTSPRTGLMSGRSSSRGGSRGQGTTGVRPMRSESAPIRTRSPGSPSPAGDANLRTRRHQSATARWSYPEAESPTVKKTLVWSAISLSCSYFVFGGSFVSRFRPGSWECIGDLF